MFFGAAAILLLVLLKTGWGGGTVAYEPSAAPKKECDYGDDNNYNILKCIDAILKIHTKILNICILAGHFV